MKCENYEKFYKFFALKSAVEFAKNFHLIAHSKMCQTRSLFANFLSFQTVAQFYDQ